MNGAILMGNGFLLSGIPGIQRIRFFPGIHDIKAGEPVLLAGIVEVVPGLGQGHTDENNAKQGKGSFP